MLQLGGWLVTKRKDPNYSQVTAHMPKEMVKQLKKYCVDQDTTLTDVVTQAIEEFLEKYDKKE